MSLEKLNTGTSTYQIQYDPPPRTRSSTPSTTASLAQDRDRLPLLDALHDPIIWEASRRLPYPGSASNNRTPRSRPTFSNLRAVLLDEDNASTQQSNTYLDHCEYPIESGSTGTELTTAPTPPPFTVTWETDDDDEGHHSSSSDEDADETLARLYYLEGYGSVRRPARRSSPGRIELRQTPEAAPEQVLQPQARFFIGKHRHKITIKFDPPV
jgi:hypothetical protein